jgi:TRAP transporter 4TM/12TM fusion protein
MVENTRRLVAATIGAFVLWTAYAGQFEPLIQRSVMVALLVLLGFLTYPLRPGGRARNWSIALDAVLASVGIVAAIYITFNAHRIMTTLPMASPLELALTVALVVVLLELARRTVGIAFPILVLIGLAYVFLGHLIPGRLGHRGFDLYFVAETIYLSDIGVWGSLTGLASTLIASFVLFGAVLLHTGGGKTFMDIALLASGRSIGGAAKMATIASASFGTVNGSAVANVATTGTLTIPLMIRLKYPPQFAAAVEAVASTGGQVTPPILGAAAFIMAEMIGVEYLRIAVAAIIPAAMFYIAVLLTIHLVALRSNVGLVPREEIPSAREALDPVRLLPVIGGLGGLIWMLTSGRSVAFSAAFGIGCMTVPFVIGDLWSRRDPVGTLRTFFHALVEGGAGIVIIGVMLAGAQILVSLLSLTGVGVTLSSLVVAVGGQNIVLIGLIVAASCLVLGMGIPTTAAYVLVASVMAPALTAVGIEPLVAHMFVFYYATISVITPPVCIAVFVAASLARIGWWPVALNAVRLGAVTYMVPFMFLAYPGMLWTGGWLGITEAALSGLLLVVATALLTSGVKLRGNRPMAWLFFLPSALLALYPDEAALAAAVVLLGLGIVLARPFRRRAEAEFTPLIKERSILPPHVS